VSRRATSFCVQDEVEVASHSESTYTTQPPAHSPTQLLMLLVMMMMMMLVWTALQVRAAQRSSAAEHIASSRYVMGLVVPQTFHPKIRKI